MLEKIVKGIAILGFMGGLNACTQYAHRDYHLYPGQESIIAFDNIQRIGQNVCEGFYVDNQRFFCRQKICTAEESGYFYSGKQYITRCSNWETRLYSFEWEDVITVETTNMFGNKRENFPYLTKVCTSEKCYTIVLNSSRQAEDFTEAVKIYLQKK